MVFSWSCWYSLSLYTSLYFLRTFECRYLSCDIKRLIAEHWVTCPHYIVYPAFTPDDRFYLDNSTIRANRTPDTTDNQLVVFFKDFFKVVLSVIGLLMILKFTFGYKISNLLTGLSIVGAAIALALEGKPGKSYRIIYYFF